MVSLPTPNLAARDRVVQCVEVSAGFSWQVTRTISATIPSGRPGCQRRAKTDSFCWADSRAVGGQSSGGIDSRRRHLAHGPQALSSQAEPDQNPVSYTHL